MDSQPFFARLLAVSLRKMLRDRQLTYDDVAKLLDGLGVVNRFGRPYSGTAVKRAVQDGSLPGYLVAAIAVAVKAKSIVLDEATVKAWMEHESS